MDGDGQASTIATKPKSEIPQELLRKYILYAREHCRPKLYQIDQDKIARLFADMRKESLATGAYPITVSYSSEVGYLIRYPLTALAGASSRIHSSYQRGLCQDASQRILQ